MKGSIFIALTIDGYIAGPDGDIEFLNQYYASVNPEDGDMGFSDFMSSIDIIVMGRKSFDKVVSFGADMWAYGDTPVIVWTRNPDSVTIPAYCSDTVSCSTLPPQELMLELFNKGHQHAYIDGGTTIREFLRADQIDELLLTRVPIVLGAGISLFEELDRRISLEHVSTSSFSNGVVTSKYRILPPEMEREES